MELLLTYSVGLALAAVLICTHYEVLSLLAKWTRRLGVAPRAWITVVMFGVFVGHTLEVGIYALAYYALEGVGMGGFTGGFEGRAVDYFRFSAVSFTTLGVGPVEPTGGFGVLSALEGLTGFTLITWSATFGYSVMRNLWDEQGAGNGLPVADTDSDRD